MKIISGKAGSPHVSSREFRQFIEGTCGQESYILTSGENLEPELSTNNLLKIRSGIMTHHGNISCVELGTYDEVTIQNGTQGMKRIDLVVNRYNKNDETGIESNAWVVIMGTPHESDPVAPDYTKGNLQDGDLIDDCQVFEVHLDGINVTKVKKLLSVLPSIPTLNADLSKLNGNMINGKFSVSEEIDTRMTWINGKKIYRKTLTTSEAIDSSGLSVSHGISNPDEIWIDYSMSYMGTTSGIFIPLNTNRYNGKNIGITIITTKSDVQFNSDSSFGTGWTKVITLLYTKK